MLKYICIILLVLGNLHFIAAQFSFTGNYDGVFNGDQVSLTLIPNEGNQWSGTMQDSQNKYDVTGQTQNNTFSGIAVEANLGITFRMSGVLNEDILNLVLTFDYLGEKHSMDVIFTKRKNGDSTQQNNDLNIPVKTRDQNVIGTWVKESNYSTGYASNGSYGAMSTRESMVFYADGAMGDGGSSTTVGGSNFSGSSSGAGTGKIPGLYWWTEQNKILLHITENGKSQQLELGRYYIENGRMLITGTNGEKILLTKQ